MNSEKGKSIAIIGAGLCGLAVAWYLVNQPGYSVTIFDEKGIGGGASGIAAGLLHKYVGAASKKNFMGEEGLAATLELIAVAQKALGRPVVDSSGMLRLATSAQQQEDFTKAAQKYKEEIEWRTADENQRLFPPLRPLPGIFVANAIVVDTKAYLEGLWLACHGRGVALQKERIESLEDLKGYDRVVVAAGAGCKSIKGLEKLALNLVKGQVLKCSWPEGVPELPCALNSHAYLLKGSNRTCIAGATYEHVFANDKPNRALAVGEILPKVQEYFPELTAEHVLDVAAGVRVSAPDRKPIALQLSEKCWVLTGMGSRGLLYHALYARDITQRL